MELYILLEHEFIAVERDVEIPVYTYKHCFTPSEFEAFLAQNGLTYNPTQRKVYQGPFERFEVIREYK